MVKEIALSPVAQVRLWYDDVSVPEYPVKGVLSGSTPSAPEAIVAHEAVCMEALIGRGARSEYGLIAVSFKASTRDSLDVEVPFSEMNGARWLSALGATVDDIRLGLPEEYATPVLDELSRGANRRFPSGTVRVFRAAHGLVGSSQNFFRQMVHSMMALRLMQQVEVEHEVLASALRDVLVRGCEIG